MNIAQWIERAIVTVLFTGFSPISPGTAASALTCVILWFVPGAMQWPGGLLIVPATFAGAWFSTRAIGVLSAPRNTKFKSLRRPNPTPDDPDPVTIDEFVGQWIALLAVPHAIMGFAAAFVMFRIFDVVKPFGIDKLQSLPAGWGIMVDDVGAGFGAAVVMLIIGYFFPALLAYNFGI
jgi:phosphatidylglycerophosphatase A